MTTLEEVFLQLENDKEDHEDFDSGSSKIVRSRAVSRSMSLQGRSGSSSSVIIGENFAENIHISGDMKGTIRFDTFFYNVKFPLYIFF